MRVSVYTFLFQFVLVVVLFESESGFVFQKILLLQYGKLSITLELIEIHWKDYSETAMLHLVTHFLTLMTIIIIIIIIKLELETIAVTDKIVFVLPQLILEGAIKLLINF